MAPLKIKQLHLFVTVFLCLFDGFYFKILLLSVFRVLCLNHEYNCKCRMLQIRSIEKQRKPFKKRTGYMLSVKQVHNSLIRFNKHLNIYFPDIDTAWLRKYETWLRSNNIKDSKHKTSKLIKLPLQPKAI